MLQKKRKLPNRLPDLLNHCAGALTRSPIYYSLLFAAALEAASTSTIWFLVQPNPSCHHHRHLLVPLEHQSLSFSRLGVVGVVGITTTAHYFFFSPDRRLSSTASFTTIISFTLVILQCSPLSLCVSVTDANSVRQYRPAKEQHQQRQWQ